MIIPLKCVKWETLQSDHKSPWAWLLLFFSCVVLVGDFWSWFLTSTMFVVCCGGCFGVCGPGLHQAQFTRCSSSVFLRLVTSGVNLANQGELSPIECRFNALQRWVIASSNHQLCCVWLRGADESHWAARGRLLLHWLPPVWCHRISYWPRYVRWLFFFPHFTYILVCFGLWWRGEEVSSWILEFNLFVTFLEVEFVSIPFYFLPVTCNIPSNLCFPESLFAMRF